MTMFAFLHRTSEGAMFTNDHLGSTQTVFTYGLLIINEMYALPTVQFRTAC